SAKYVLQGMLTVQLPTSQTIPHPNGPKYYAIITSPPYPNRMSYIRELRPYMYWLGFLSEAKQAGALDWSAIGGTWGSATSLVGKWKANGAKVPHPRFSSIIEGISRHSPLLANYVHKYFADMTAH